MIPPNSLPRFICQIQRPDATGFLRPCIAAQYQKSIVGFVIDTGGVLPATGTVTRGQFVPNLGVEIERLGVTECTRPALSAEDDHASAT